jgi:hypothetical protein
MKKIITKNKAYYTSVYRLAKACDVYFDLALQMLKSRSDGKRLKRKLIAHGSFMDWETTLMDTLGLAVCECSKSDGETIKIRIFMTQDELPEDKRYLWQESTIKSRGL